MSVSAPSEGAETDIGLDQRMRAHDQRQLAAGELGEDVPAPARGRRAAQQRRRDRLGADQSLDSREMLLGQGLRGRHQRRLVSVLDRAQHRVQRHHRLAAAHLPHQQPLHRARPREIRADLARASPMQRLLMGEVGSGKTVVALYAMLRAVEHGHQAALMAPTETLAEQHFATIQRLIGAEPVACALLTGSTAARRREDVVGKLASGELSLVVGTHALIEPDVAFASLAVAVVDEQHRFGVRQRAALHAKGVPHTLHMTATPIPRTLALAGYGDLDTSTLRELPHGRQPIDTRIVAGERARARAYDRLREQLTAGRQAFVVCPLIDEEPASDAQQATPPSGLGDLRAATAELERLRKGELRGYRLVLLHGGMRPREKRLAMTEFAEGRADVLVATTVIEVGIDVPNATVMLVENAERFGISQLHQLRGRIGRGEHHASCLLMGPPGSARLRALAEHSDGFALAEIDLELRSEGELVGTRQSGLRQFNVAQLPQDAPLLERARARAEAIVASDPELREPENALLGDALRESFGAEALEPIPA